MHMKAETLGYIDIGVHPLQILGTCPSVPARIYATDTILCAIY